MINQMNCVNTYKYKISIILPCYNVEEYIDNAVSAILKQTFKDYEVIFINDGSTDDTLEVIKKHCCHNNFRVFDFQNQGVAQARNEGMRLSQGEYLYFMDPDDDMDETLLEVALEECEKKHADAVQFHYYCQGASFNGDKGNAVYEGEEITRGLLPRFIGYSGDSLKLFGTSKFYDSNEWASVWRFLFKASVIKDNQISFPRGIKMSEDRFFILKFLCYANKIVTIDKKLYHYIIRSTGCMSKGLNDPKALINNKMDGVRERAKIRDLFILRKNIDIFEYYSGSLVLSCLELYVKLSKFSFFKGWKAIRCYTSQPDIKKAIRSCRVITPIKLSISLLCIKWYLGFFMYGGLWLLNKLKVAK